MRRISVLASVLRMILGGIFGGAVLMAGMGAVGAARAQSFDFTKIQGVPRYDGLSQADFEARTAVIKDVSRQSDHLSFEVRLPPDWKKTRDNDSAPDSQDSGKKPIPQWGDVPETAGAGGGANPLNNYLLVNVARYVGPTKLDGLSRFDVRALELNYEITTRNWFLNYILSNSYTLEGFEQISDRRVEALYVLVERDVSYVVRTVAEINGKHIVLASYAVPDSRWEEEKEIQQNVVGSFRFSNQAQIQMEQTKSFDYLDLLTFSYPVSWRLVTPYVNSMEGFDAQLINSRDDTTLKGEIEIHVVSTELDTTLAQEVQTLRGELEKIGLKIGELIEVPDQYEFAPHVYFNRVEVYDAQARDKSVLDHEYWLAVLVEDRYYYLVSMLTPARETDFYTWARNGEAFETVIESIRPLESSRP